MSAIAARKSAIEPTRSGSQTLSRRKSEGSLTRSARSVEDAARRIVAVAARDEARASSIAPIMSAVAAAAEADASSLEGLIAVLERPELLEHLQREDPLARARLRGIRARQRLLDAEGGVVSGQAFADLVGVSRQAIDKRRRNGTLVGLSLGKKGFFYPVWQADIDGLKPVLGELREYGPWAQAIFMLTPNRWLGGETPLAALRLGETRAVVSAASMYGEQAASSNLLAEAGGAGPVRS